MTVLTLDRDKNYISMCLRGKYVLILIYLKLKPISLRFCHGYS